LVWLKGRALTQRMHWMGNLQMDWRFSEVGYWGRCLGVGGRRQRESAEEHVTGSFMSCTAREIWCGRAGM